MDIPERDLRNAAAVIREISELLEFDRQSGISKRKRLNGPGILPEEVEECRAFYLLFAGMRKGPGCIF